MSPIWLYIANTRQNRDLFVQSPTYTYSCLDHSSTNNALFRITLCRYPPDPITVFSQSVLPEDAINATDPKVLCQKILRQVAAIQKNQTLWRDDKESTNCSSRRGSYSTKLYIMTTIYDDILQFTLVLEDKKALQRCERYFRENSGLSPSWVWRAMLLPSMKTVYRIPYSSSGLLPYWKWSTWRKR